MRAPQGSRVSQPAETPRPLADAVPRATPPKGTLVAHSLTVHVLSKHGAALDPGQPAHPSHDRATCPLQPMWHRRRAGDSGPEKILLQEEAEPTAPLRRERCLGAAQGAPAATPGLPLRPAPRARRDRPRALSFFLVMLPNGFPEPLAVHNHCSSYVRRGDLKCP